MRGSLLAGKVEIITSYVKDGETPTARLQVRDFGQGMNLDVKSRIFEPFSTTSEAQGGLGMGLFVVRTLVEDLGASLILVSDEARGATFTIDFPIVPDPPKKANQS